MADLIEIDYDTVSEISKSTMPGFVVTSPFFPQIQLKIISGRFEEVNGKTFYSDGVNTVEDFSTSFGDAYVYISDNFDGTASAILSNTVPSYDASKKGFYFGNDKAIYKVDRSLLSPLIQLKQLKNPQRIGYTPNRTMGDFCPSKIRTDTITPTGELFNCCYGYSGLTTETAIVEKMAADGFVQETYYAANGYIHDNITAWRVVEISYRGSGIFFTGATIDGAYRVRADYSGFVVQNTALVIFKKESEL